MGIREFFFGSREAPQAAVQSRDGGVVINSPQDLADAIEGQMTSKSGQTVNANTALKVAAVFACVRIISGAVANLPIHVKRRIDAETREDASGHFLWKLLRKKPNRWQTPSQYRRMMQAHLLLRGNAYSLKVKGVQGKVVELLPMHPDRIEVKQADDLSIAYEYTNKSGRKQVFPQEAIMHLVGLTLDGVNGVSVITYARETIGLSLSMEDHGATTFKNGARPSSVLKHPGKLGPEAIENLRASLEAYKMGGESEGKSLVLEEGMDVSQLTMTAEDVQYIESRKFSRSDIAMFFGVPPHMIGDTEKSTSWGSGIEQQSIGFATYTLEDHLTTWEETINRDLVPEQDDDIYSRFNRNALVRGDMKTRQGFYTAMMQWGVYSPNEVRALEEMNPRDGGEIYYDPPNTAGGQDTPQESEGDT
ncbi:phage portal protein [Cohaesibacter gelatinilyticus]|uniref:Phage portal protein, HK97 family n=1 Tax=Cohaesibacter gelatinilyticus TaxID=372072 RepID=A0A285PJ11_9HYPH|nr:phage portal protein [Cohaesibacter gelatinilyticus]SNZ21712.1 phage portal protein, HK97 family [Cohaesibacter gelatinilyticus]